MVNMPGKRQRKSGCGGDLDIHILNHSICGVFNCDRLDRHSTVLLHSIVDHRQNCHIHANGFITDTIRLLGSQRQFLGCLVCLLCTVIFCGIGSCGANLFHSSHQRIDLILLRLQQLYKVCVLRSIFRDLIFRGIESPVTVYLHQPAAEVEGKVQQGACPFLRIQPHMYCIVSCFAKGIEHIVNSLWQKVGIFQCTNPVCMGDLLRQVDFFEDTDLLCYTLGNNTDFINAGIGICV